LLPPPPNDGSVARVLCGKDSSSFLLAESVGPEGEQ